MAYVCNLFPQETRLSCSIWFSPSPCFLPGPPAGFEHGTWGSVLAPGHPAGRVPPFPDPVLGVSPEGRGALPSAGGADLEPRLNRLLTGQCLKPARVRAKPEVYCARGDGGSGRKEAPAVSLNHIHF